MSQFDGVVAFNDALALGAMRVVQEAGLSVPRDVAFIGFDDIDETRYSLPTLSTIDPSQAEIADVAVGWLLERIAADPGSVAPREHLTTPRLVRARVVDPALSSRPRTTSTRPFGHLLTAAVRLSRMTSTTFPYNVVNRVKGDSMAATAFERTPPRARCCPAGPDRAAPVRHRSSFVARRDRRPTQRRATTTVKSRTPKKMAAVVATVSAGALLTLLGACSPDVSTDTGTANADGDGGGGDGSCSNTIVYPDAPQVSVWAWYPNINTVVDMYNKEHNDVQVCWSNAGQGGDEYAKFSTSIAAGSGAPDVIMLEAEVLPGFELQKALVDLSEHGADEVKGNFSAGAWKDVSSGDSVYAIPVDGGPMAMIYRSDIFEKYGIDDPHHVGRLRGRGAEAEGRRRPVHG